MKTKEKSILDYRPEIKTVASRGWPTNPSFEKKRLDAIKLVEETRLFEQLRQQASRK